MDLLVLNENTKFIVALIVVELVVNGVVNSTRTGRRVREADEKSGVHSNLPLLRPLLSTAGKQGLD
jgi:hypothetical protein